MKSPFLRLTSPNGSPIIINVNTIQMISPNTGKGGVRIALVGSDTDFADVTDSMETIFSKIENVYTQ